MKRSGGLGSMAALGLALLMGACTPAEAPAEQTKAVQQAPAATPQQKAKAQAEVSAPRMDSLSFEDFRRAFFMQKRPKTVNIAKDFSAAQLKTCAFFRYLAIHMPDGEYVPLREADFYALAFYTNSRGNHEMLSMREVGGGKFVYLSTYDPKLKMLGTTELARLHDLNGERSEKWGVFVDEINYHYTYTLHEFGQLKDSLQGSIVVTPDGRHRSIGEARLN